MAFLNWYFLLFYSISLSCGLLIFRAMRTPPPRPKTWLYKAIAVLVVTWGSNFMSMQLAAICGGMAWLLLIVMPSLGGRKIQDCLYRQDYQGAYRLSLVLRYLHPFDGWWDQPQIVKTLQLGQRGETAAAQAILQQYLASPSGMVQQAIAINYVIANDWSGLLQWFQTDLKTIRDPLLMMYYCRALGETGHLHELLQEVKSTKRKFIKGGNQRTFYLVQLFACAFCGEVQLVEQLLSGCLNLYPIHIKNFWRAIARYAAGEKAIAAQILTELLENPDANFRQAIRLYLNNPPWVAKKRLQPESFPLIAELTREIKEEKIDRPYQSLLDYRPFYKQGFSINLLLILVNSLVFVGGLLFDLKFGSNAFIDLGAFIPKNVWAGEWWRIFTATFLHISWGHLLTNMLTLYLLGNFVEKHLGKWRYLLVYLCSGIGAMLLILVAVTLTRDLNFNLLPNWTNFLTNEIRYDDREWVGASGSIMGMIGAIAIILWRGWSRKQSQSALRQFRLIVGISCLQFAIDLSSTNVSFYSHFWGLILGIVLTLKLTEKPFKTLKNCSIK